jgi:hypothetical protein
MIGQIVNVVVCSKVPMTGAIGEPFQFQSCPEGESGYIVKSYLPISTSQSFFEGLEIPFDASIAGGIFSFGFGLVVFFFLLGLKGSVILRPFWSRSS